MSSASAMASDDDVHSLLTNLVVPTHKQMLGHLSNWLDKANKELDQKEEKASFLQSRLALDMYPLDTQVRFVCLQAQEAVLKLQGMNETPPHLVELLQEGRSLAESADGSSLEQAKARIQQTLEFLDSVESNKGTSSTSATSPLTQITIELPR